MLNSAAASTRETRQQEEATGIHTYKHRGSNTTVFSPWVLVLCQESNNREQSVVATRFGSHRFFLLWLFSMTQAGFECRELARTLANARLDA